MRLVPRFAGTLRSPQIEMRSAHGWRQPELHFGEARSSLPGIPRTAWRRFAGTLRSPQIKMRFAHGAIRTSAHLRRASVLRSKTLAEAEFISAEHCDTSGLPKRWRPFWEVRAERGHAEAARRAAHRRDGARGRVIRAPSERKRAAAKAAHISKGPFSTIENGPFGTPRERKGCALDLPLEVFL